MKILTGEVVIISLICIAITTMLTSTAMAEVKIDSEPILEKSNLPVISLTSSAFNERENIPDRYTCMGENISPELRWNLDFKGIKAFVIICEDPDAPKTTWLHWALYDIPSSITSLPANVPPVPELEFGAKHGINDFNVVGYGGPCPPKGRPHRYIFKIYALNDYTGLDSGVDISSLREAMEGKIVAEGSLTGLYRR